MNENCLAGIACPKCHEDSEIMVRVSAMVRLFDDGTDDIRDVEYDDDSMAACTSCDFRGVLGDFRRAEPARDAT